MVVPVLRGLAGRLRSRTARTWADPGGGQAAAASLCQRDTAREAGVMNVEFTDRYDGRAPSWLRGCFGDCEAMGYVPVPRERNPDGSINVETEWDMVKCPTCRGTGRVSWLTTVARIPRWMWKGATFMKMVAPAREMHPPSWTARQRWWLCFKCAFLYDLGWPK